MEVDIIPKTVENCLLDDVILRSVVAERHELISSSSHDDDRQQAATTTVPVLVLVQSWAGDFACSAC